MNIHTHLTNLVSIYCSVYSVGKDMDYAIDFNLSENYEFEIYCRNEKSNTI